MSSFIGAAQATGFIVAEDLRAVSAYYLVDVEFIDNDAFSGASWATPWWPMRTGFVGSSDDVGVGYLLEALWGAVDHTFGTSSRFAFVGVTRNQYGSPVGFCDVMLYRTSDRVLIDATKSDTNGKFYLTTPYYPDTHFIVAHKTGSPDFDGISPNTLIGA